MVTFANRVRMTTATVGTGAITLGSAVAGYVSFQEGGIPNGATVSYCIEDGNSFEFGRGVYNASTQQLTRSVIQSKVDGEAAGPGPLSLSGTAKVFLTFLAEDFVDPTIDTLTLTGYLDLTEITTPVAPAANVARLFAYDDAGQTRLAFRDSNGMITLIGGVSPDFLFQNYR